MKRTFLMIAFAALATIAYSQTDDKGYEEGKYVLKGVSGLNLSQTAMTNWSAATLRKSFISAEISPFLLRYLMRKASSSSAFAAFIFSTS